MVGTRAMRRPAVRWALVQFRRSEMALSSSMERVRARDSLLKTVLPPWVFAVPHFRRVRPHCLPHGLSQFGVVLQKLRREPFVQAENIVKNKSLPVAMRSGADPDSR